MRRIACNSLSAVTRSLRFAIPLVLVAGAAAAQDGYETSCNEHDAKACLEIAEAYSSHLSAPIPYDAERAARLAGMARKAASKGCRSGLTADCHVLIDATFGTFSLPPASLAEKQEALEILKAVAGLGCATAWLVDCALYGVILPHMLELELAASSSSGMTTEAILDDFHTRQLVASAMYEAIARQASPSLRAECESGVLKSCGHLADTLDNEGGDLSYKTELRVLACGADIQSHCDRSALLILQSQQDSAISVDAMQSIDASREHLLGLCDGGQATACFSAAKLASDEKSSVEYVETSCKMGLASACRVVGQTRFRVYLKTNAADDLEATVSVLSRACDLQDAYACHMLEHISRG